MSNPTVRKPGFRGQGSRHSILLSALLLCSTVRGFATDGEFDWERDRVVLLNGKEARGVVIESFDPQHLVLLHDGNRREEIPHAEIQRVDKLRDRLAGFLSLRKPGLSFAAEWSLAEDAERVGLHHMARLQAYHVLLLDPAYAPAHEYLGHKSSGGGWKWEIDEKQVSAEKFKEMSREWNHRLVLESEHFVVETDGGLRRGIDILFDLEGLYVWWMEHLGPQLLAAEDVDDPQEEKITFLVHRDREDSAFQPLTSARNPYYDPAGEFTTTKGGINVARTYFTPDFERPQLLFELGVESLIYSTLVLGKIKGREPDIEMKRHCHWVEVGLGYWVAQHCGGKAGYPEIRAPFSQPFDLDRNTARRTLEKLNGPHPLLMATHELTNLIGLFYDHFTGTSTNVVLAQARCGSFVAYLIEEDPPGTKGKKILGHGRAALWHYLREVYGTPRAHSSDAFDTGLGGAKIETLEDGWKAWARGFTKVTPGVK